MPADDKGRGAEAQSAPTLAAETGDVDSHADTAMANAHDETLVGDDTDTEAPSSDELVGTILQERYEITRRIGQGGMGAVYEGKHLALGKRVAVKVLLDKYTTKDSVVARLEQEARLASSIGHDNIVDITDFGETEAGRTFVVMEFLEGESLGQLLAREGALEEQRLLKIARQIASALGAAHHKGIVHRDIKPENVFLRQRSGRDTVKVVDFGISKHLNGKEEPEGGVSPRLTQTGMVLGTPLYMSPEQARGDEDPDHRIDIYSLGVIMYEMATGEVPFRGGNYLNIVSQVISSEPTGPRELNQLISEDLEAVILKSLEKEADDRYQSMEELEADLAALDSGELGSTSARITASRRRRQRNRKGWVRVLKWAGAGLVTLSLVVIAVMMFTRRSGGDQQAVLPAPPPVDAAPPPPPVDAAPAVPVYEMASITIKSRPPGATLMRDGNTIEGKTPFTVKLVKENKNVEFVLELEGYDFETMSINPLEDDGKTRLVRLKKPRRRPARRYKPKSKPKEGDKSGGAERRDRGHDDGGGDLIRPGGR